jgi:uncharacterized protein YecT (DUF1311 family)
MARATALPFTLLAFLAACTETAGPVALPVASEIPAAPLFAMETAAATAGGAAVAPPGPASAVWAGKWTRWSGRMDPAELEIRAVSAGGFAFEISASFGGHVGGAEGQAVFTPDGARFDSQESGCALTFRARDGSVEVEQAEGSCITYGARVTGAGRYRPAGEKRVYETSFDCRKAMGPVETAVCGSPVLAGADRALATAFAERLGALAPAVRDTRRAEERAWLKERDTCRAAASPERCTASAYRRRFATLGGPRAHGFDFAAFQKRTEGQPGPWADLDLRLYLMEQLPPARYEALADAMMLESVLQHDALGVEIQGCVYGVCPDFAVYLRIEPPGTVWVAVYGDGGAVVFSPRKATPEPGSLGRWLTEHAGKQVVRETVFE